VKRTPHLAGIVARILIHEQMCIPLLRYRTRDLTSLDTARCDCGRTLARMVKVRERTDDMLIVRGVNFYPAQIEEVLEGIEGARGHGHVAPARRRRNMRGPPRCQTRPVA
jgi:phenylacetate-coenzyme A ligase PaaK-like adenylate-forming protein